MNTPAFTVKIVDSGWLSLLAKGSWVPVFKLTDDQMRQWILALSKTRTINLKPKETK